MPSSYDDRRLYVVSMDEAPIHHHYDTAYDEDQHGHEHSVMR